MILLRRYAGWLILATLAGIAGAWLASADHPVRYTSTAQVDVEPRLTGLTTPVAPNMGTEQLVATSGVVVTRTARILHTTPGQLDQALTAGVARATLSGTTATGAANVLTIGCTMPAPAAAQRCTAAAAASYMAFRNHTGQRGTGQKHAALQVTLITSAAAPVASDGPRKHILVPIGALAGFALGIGAVFLRDRLDHRVRDSTDLERCSNAPVLAVIPRARRRYGHPALIMSRHPLSPVAEAYRYLRENIDPLIRSVPDDGTVLLVASAQSRDGRTSVAANLATALAEAGTAVILVDADLRHPALSGIFGSPHRPGLADLLAGTASVEEVAVPAADVPGLRLITAGDPADRAAHIFQMNRLSRAFGDMRAQADVVVVDSAPVLTASQGITLARVSDVVAFVADVRRTERDAVSTAVQQLRVAGPNIIVGVLNGVPLARNGQILPSATRSAGTESLDSASIGPEIRAPVVPAPAPNGKRRASFQRNGAPHRDQSDP